MIDPKLLRTAPNDVIRKLSRRGVPLDIVHDAIQKDAAWRDAIHMIDTLKAERNRLTPRGKPTEDERKSLAALSNDIKDRQITVNELELAAKTALLALPNLISDDVPDGKNSNDNPVLRTVGCPRTFLFTPKSHDDLGAANGWLDMERAAKIAGARFAVYTGRGARLERALINFMLDIHTSNHGYTEILPPAIINSNSLIGTGQLPKFGDDLFQLTNSDFWLSPTAEVQLTNLYATEIIDESLLPIRLTAHTPCFRKEAGSYGKDIRGLIRLHQFNKIELVQLVSPSESQTQLMELTHHAEKILSLLELPYRVVQLCAGDTGFSSCKTIDIEVWLPSANTYREISSCSLFGDFQARRSMIRYKRADENVAYIHTINGSGLAVGRTWAAVVENYQNPDGSIDIPTVLKPYM